MFSTHRSTHLGEHLVDNCACTKEIDGLPGTDGTLRALVRTEIQPNMSTVTQAAPVGTKLGLKHFNYKDYLST